MEKVIKHHFVRFCLVGALGFAINYVLLTLFYKELGWPLFLAQLLAGEIALFNNFMFHHHWTYKGHGKENRLVSLLVQFHATSWVAVVGTALVVSFCVHYLHLHYFPALVIGGILALIWNFIWSKYVIWRKHSHSTSETEQ
jgi:dolichol-phosphate mannosyltransferase